MPEPVAMVMMQQPMAVSFALRSRTPSRSARVSIAGAVFTSVLCVAAPFVGALRAQIAGTAVPGLDKDLVAASLVSDAQSVAPGGTFRLAVRLAPDDGWHLNWLNPGDAGLAPSIRWIVPDGFKVGPPCWPLPERFRTGPLVIFGYSGELLLVVDVRSPAELPASAALEFRAEVSWLACSEACIPGDATVALTLPVREAGATDPGWSARIEASLARCPRASLDWNVEARVSEAGMIDLDISAGNPSAKIEDVFFYPYEPGLIENAAPQRLSVLASPTGRAAYQLRVELSRMAAGVPSRLSGILVSRSGWSGGDEARAIEIDVPLGHR